MFVMNVNAQSTKSLQAFKKLSSAEKCWVYFHPFKAKKAYIISRKVSKTVDSIKKVGDLGNHFVGNQLDAFKHAYWMWCLADGIGNRSAKSLGKAHEKGNYQSFKKQKKEDGVLPDQVSCEMDLYNNFVGLSLYKKYKKQSISKNKMIEIVKTAVIKGMMKMIYQTNSRQYLDSNSKVIPVNEYYNLWKNNKHLVFSNTVFSMPKTD